MEEAKVENGTSTPKGAGEESKFMASPVKREAGRGSWREGAFHLATTIATPAAFAPLPSAIAALGWPAGVFTLVLGTAVTYGCSLLLASLWDWDEPNRHVRYRDLARSIYGKKGYYSVTFFQQIASIGNNIAIQIVAGISMKAIYQAYSSNQNGMTLQDFIIIFGVVELLLSQMPDIHSLRWLNALCTFCTIGFTVTVIGLSIYALKNSTGTSQDYSLVGTAADKTFGVFTALGTIAFSFGDAMLPEIQATLREPAKTNMYKGASLAYGVIAVSYWVVAFLGFAVFGNGVNAYLVNSFTGPTWAITLANIFAIIQVLGCFQIYCRPTYFYFELKLMNPKQGPFSLRNALSRLGVTTVYTVIVTLIAAAVPFFGDFVALCGAIGFTPLDFIIPIIAYLKVRNPKNRFLWVVYVTIIVLYTIVAILGSIGAIQFINRDTARYKFFGNL